MKVYFDGGSWTWGGELKNREEERYSRLLCTKLNAEEHNVATAGASNERILRQLYENNINQYDLVVIFMAPKNRCEYYDQKWKKMGIEHTALWKPWKPKKTDPFWDYYYRHIYNDIYGSNQEYIIKTAIENHCKLYNVPLIIKTSDEIESMPLSRAKGGHPNEDGHQSIATDLVTLLRQKNRQ
mgnify:FL=1